MGFKPGNIANPNGRPVGTRSIADSLRKVSHERVKVKGHYVTKTDVLSRMVFDALTTFTAVSVDGKVLRLSPKLWLDLVKFVSVHIDGPMPAQLDITSGGLPVKAYIGFSPDDWLDVVEGEIIEDSDTKQLSDGL